MACYDFKCDECTNEFDYTQSIHDDLPHIVYCPNCGSGETHRVYYAPALKFRGKGWGKTPPKPKSFDIEDRR